MDIADKINDAMEQMARGPIPLDCIDVVGSKLDKNQLVVSVQAKDGQMFSLKESLVQLSGAIPFNYMPTVLPDLILIGVDISGVRWIVNNPFPETMFSFASDERIGAAVNGGADKAHGLISRVEVLNPANKDDALIAEIFAFCGVSRKVTDWMFEKIRVRTDEYMALIGEMRELADYDFILDEDPDFLNLIHDVKKLPISTGK